MLQRALAIVVGIIVLIYVVQNPTEAGTAVRDIFNAVIAFVRALFSGSP